MAKYKAAKKKTDAPPQIRPGVPCLIIIVGAMLVVALTMYLALRNG